MDYFSDYSALTYLADESTHITTLNSLQVPIGEGSVHKVQ